MTVNKKVYKCEICDGMFSKHPNPKTPMANLKGHIRNIHKLQYDEYVMQYLLSDVIINKNNRLQCQICGMEFTHPVILSKHLKKYHNVVSIEEYFNKYLRLDGEGLCETCGKPLKFTTILRPYRQYCNTYCQMIGTHHNIDRPYQCKICNKAYPEKYLLDNHLKLEHNIDYITHLVIHIKPKIDKNDKLQCQLCGDKFIRISELGKHLNKYHNYITTQEYYNTFIRKFDEGICPQCGKDTSFMGLEIGYTNEYCSIDCSSVSDTTKQKMIKSCLVIGEDGLNKYQRVGKKCKITKLNDIDENGNNSYDRLIKKMNNTKLNDIDENGNNGYDRAVITARKNSLKKYGVEHPMQVTSIAAKLCNNYKYKTYKLPSGKVIKLQGYEPQAMDILLTTYKESEILTDRCDVPEIWYKTDDGKKHRYYPDIYIPKDNLIIEVKSDWTLNKYIDINILKMEACINTNHRFEFMVL